MRDETEVGTCRFCAKLPADCRCVPAPPTRTEEPGPEEIVARMVARGIDVRVLSTCYGTNDLQAPMCDYMTTDGEVWALTAGDQGYEPTGIKVPMFQKTESDLTRLREQIETFRETLKPDPFCAPDCACDVSTRYRKFNALFPPERP